MISKRTNQSISVIIPTLNAESDLPVLLNQLHLQTIKPDEIVVVDSDSKDRTVEICQNDTSVKLVSIDRASFDHGGTRDKAFSETTGDIVLFFTQDAVPANNELIEILVRSINSHPKAAAAYARQLPRDNASPQERLVRLINYPDFPAVHNKKSISSLGIRAFFMSNVCAAYRRDTYLSLGGFEHDLRTNEDMLFAAKAINSGYEIIYEPRAIVVHSHNLTLKQQYERNKLQGYEMARHGEILKGESPVSAGTEMLIYVTKGLLKEGRVLNWAKFICDCGARYIGNRAGKREYKKEINNAG